MLSRNTRNTVLKEVPLHILEKTAHIADPTVRLAVSCGLMNREAGDSFTGARGSPVDTSDARTSNHGLDAAIADFGRIMDEGGYDDPYYDPATDSYQYEFSVRDPDRNGRVRVRADTIEKLATRIGALTTRTRRRIDDGITGGIYILDGPGTALVEALRDGTFDDKFEAATGARFASAGITTNTINGTRITKFVAGADPPARMVIDRLLKRHGGLGAVLDMAVRGEAAAA